MERWARLAAPLTFLLLGTVLLPWPGLQNDEAAFAATLFEPAAAFYHIRVFGHEAPLMMLSYLGTLKSLLWWPVFSIFEPSIWSIRIPALVAGALTIWIFMLLLARIHGRTAAWIGGALLATDSCFLMTTCFDWGPVALQHLLFVSIMLLAVIFNESRRAWPLAGCFLCAGLALWDKALAIWMLSGMSVAVVAAFFGKLQALFTLRRAGVAAAALCLGGLPLLVYNATGGAAAFWSNTRHDTAHMAVKVEQVRLALNGSALFGYMVNEPDAPQPRQLTATVERGAAALHSFAGDWHTNWMLPAYGAALLLAAPLLITRVHGMLLFCIVAAVVAWIQMALTRNAGISVHHVILLWPLPAMLVAITLAELSKRAGRIGPVLPGIVGGVLLTTNLLNVNQYVYQFARFGSNFVWTDAMGSLWSDLRNRHGIEFCALDWGIAEPLKALSRARLPVVMLDVSNLQRRQAAYYLSRADTLFLMHTDDKQIFAGVNEKFKHLAGQEGFGPRESAIWKDRNGRAVFEGVRYARVVAK